MRPAAAPRNWARAATRGLFRGRLRRGALAKLASELVARLASFAVTLWAARALGEAGFGLYSYGLALGFVVGQGADMGLQVLTARHVAIYGRGARGDVRRALQLKLALAVPVLLLLWVLSGGRPGPERAAVLLLGTAMLLETFLQFVAHVFRGQQRLAREAWLLAAGRLLTAAVAGLVLWRGGGLLGLGVAWAAAAASWTAVALVLLGREGWLSPSPAAAAPGLLRLLGHAAPLGLATFFSIAYLRGGILLLEHMADAVAVAHFSAAQRLVEAAQVLPAALMAAVFPAYAARLPAEPAGAARLATKSCLVLAAAGVVVVAGFSLGAPLLVPFLFGDPFRPAVPVLRVLAVAALPMYVNYALTQLLVARGRQGSLAWFMGGMLLLHLGTSWWLIPRVGAVGVAASAVLSEVVLLACCLGALFVLAPREALRPESLAAPG